MMKRRELARWIPGAAVAAILGAPRRSWAATPIPATLYKNPGCTCCDNYAQYLDRSGFQVEVKPTPDLARISREAGVPEAIAGCHAMFVAGYVVDGHVPVEIVRRLLAEKPAVVGISLPGMPLGSPGMDGAKAGPFTVYAIPKDGATPFVFSLG